MTAPGRKRPPNANGLSAGLIIIWGIDPSVSRLFDALRCTKQCISGQSINVGVDEKDRRVTSSW